MSTARTVPETERWIIELPTMKVKLDLVEWTITANGTLLVWELNSEGLPVLSKGWSRPYWLTINREGR